MENTENTGHKMTEINSGNPFMVPEGYFNTLHERINTRISEKAFSKRTIHLKQNWRLYAAAAVFLIMVFIGGRQMLFGPRVTAATLQNEISQLVEAELYSIQEETIINAMATEESRSQELNHTEAIDYLMNEDLNESELINAL